MNSIFVMIASYRDRELVPTITDCFAKSSGENKITIGLVWQKDDSESLGEFAHNKDIRVIDVEWNKSEGLGWARSLAQSLYRNEDYILQLDSHHRFLKNWDKVLIEMLEGLKYKSEKPLLTSYAAGYDPDNDTNLTNDAPSRVLPIDFKKSGTIWLRPTIIGDYKSLKEPINARFISGHYYFTLGSHIKDFAYDPNMYFAGDEISLSVRSYTAGYDLYHPHINVVWHHYGRWDRSKHWADHDDKQKGKGVIDKTWLERDEYSKKRLRQMLGMEDSNIDLGIYGLGKERSLEDFERYAGYDFKNRRIHKAAIDGQDPPAIYDADQWGSMFEKQFSYSTTSWPRYFYLQNLNNIDYVDISYICLCEKIVKKERLMPQDIVDSKNHYHTQFVTDNIPFKVSFDAIKNNTTIHNWSHDTQKGVHWF